MRERELQDIIRRLAYDLLDAREGSAEYQMIERQLDGIRRTELGGLLMQEFDMGGYSAVAHW